MKLELNDQEREVLITLLEARTGELLHELHHAVRNEYKTALREELELTQEILAKISAPVAA